DVRVIATSNRDLIASIEDGDFRGDLYYRLNVLPIHLPPLRERREDIRPLAEHFVGAFCAREGRPRLDWSPAAMASIEAYPWPGNVRELQNICERAVVLASAGGAERIDAGLVEPWLRASPRSIAEVKPAPVFAETSGSNGFAGEPVVRPLAEIERETIIRALHHFGGHRQKTARALGIGVRTLGLKLKKWKEEQLVPATL
ncbi:MAG TPA: sigma-54-dependent Fis family transcriptional regulator, partial [Phycisphaerales bacterium]|nr:sigma-54-dependent Fis family transcriptional regulator [Phycisphaerales bacterium]